MQQLQNVFKFAVCKIKWYKIIDRQRGFLSYKELKQRSFDVFSDVSLREMLNKKSRRHSFETIYSLCDVTLQAILKNNAFIGTEMIR